MKKNIAKNYIYQLIFQLMKIILPIVTVPLISNVFGPSGVGVYSFSNSIVQYFVLTSSLGMSIYGSRIIASDYANRNRYFNELFSLKIVTTGISMILYYIIILMYQPQLLLLYIIQSLSILAVVFDISWYYMGTENFKRTSMNNLIVQLIAFLLIVTFVKEPNDLYLYAFIQGAANIFSYLGVWIHIKKELRINYVKFRDTKYHLKNLLIYFIPQVGVIFYTTLNKTVLGFLGTSNEVGFYTNATNLTSICITLITTIDLVMLPRMSNLYSNREIDKMKNILSESIHFQLLVSVPAMLGLILIIPNMTPWFFGKNFYGINKYIYMITPLIIIIPLGMSLSRQFLIPIGKTGIYNMSIILGSIIGLTSNLFFVPKLGITGAMLSYLLSEIVVFLYRLIRTNKYVSIRLDFKEVLKIFIAGFFMLIVASPLANKMSPNIMSTFVLIFTGASLYLATLYMLNSRGLNKVLKYINLR